MRLLLLAAASLTCALPAAAPAAEPPSRPAEIAPMEGCCGPPSSINFVAPLCCGVDAVPVSFTAYDAWTVARIGGMRVFRRLAPEDRYVVLGYVTAYDNDNLVARSARNPRSGRD